MHIIYSNLIYEHSHPLHQYVLGPLSQQTTRFSYATGNYGWFATSFTQESCSRFYMVSPVERYPFLCSKILTMWERCALYSLLVVQTMISQVILGVRWVIFTLISDHDLIFLCRTVNIARRRSWVTWVMITAFTITTALEWFTNLFHWYCEFHFPLAPLYVFIYALALTSNASASLLYSTILASWSRFDFKGNCWAGNSGPLLSAWIFHLLLMIYDLVAMTISTVFLFNMNIRDKRLSRLPKMWVVPCVYVDEHATALYVYFVIFDDFQYSCDLRQHHTTQTML